jgi:hypothetical protein
VENLYELANKRKQLDGRARDIKTELADCRSTARVYGRTTNAKRFVASSNSGRWAKPAIRFSARRATVGVFDAIHSGPHDPIVQRRQYQPDPSDCDREIDYVTGMARRE